MTAPLKTADEGESEDGEEMRANPTMSRGMSIAAFPHTKVPAQT